MTPTEKEADGSTLYIEFPLHRKDSPCANTISPDNSTVIQLSRAAALLPDTATVRDISIREVEVYAVPIAKIIEYSFTDVICNKIRSYPWWIVKTVIGFFSVFCFMSINYKQYYLPWVKRKKAEAEAAQKKAERDALKEEKRAEIQSRTK